MTWSPETNGRPIASTSCAGEEAAVVERRRRGEQDGELGAGHARDQPRRAVGLDLALDPPRRRLQHRVAGGAAEGGVDRVVAADRDAASDQPRLLAGLGEPIGDPGARGAAVAQAGQRVAARRRRRPRIGSARPTIAPSLRRGHDGRCGRRRSPPWAKAVASPVASSRSIASRAARRPSGSSLRNSSIRLIRRPSSSPKPGLARERRAQLDGARARLPAPGSGLGLLPRVAAGAPVAADPLGVAARELEGVEQLRLGERADQEMGRAMLVEGVERGRVGAREQDQQGGGIGLDRVGDRAHRLRALRRARRARRPPRPPRRRRRSAPRHCRRGAPRSAASRRSRRAAISSSRWRKERMKSGAPIAYALAGPSARRQSARRVRYPGLAH